MSPTSSSVAFFLVFASAGVTAACSSQDAAPAYDWGLGAGVPVPAVPVDNPMSEAKVALGRRLFFDKRISGNGTQSCASCHDPAKAFTDGLALPKGSTGSVVPRNAMTLTNVGYRMTFTWANPTLHTLEAQALVPLTADAPVELGFHRAAADIAARLAADALYPSLFADAFPGEPLTYDARHVAMGLAAFERTLISRDSPYDRFAYGRQIDAMTESQKRGMDLFFNEKVECYHCHSGQDFTNSMRTAETTRTSTVFENDGLYNVGGRGEYPADNAGLRNFTKLATDDGKFRVPTLRNIALTAPYMHDGSLATLEEVVDMYAAGGRNVTSGPNAGDGRTHPSKSSFVRGFTLNAQEREDLLAFLRSLTDETFVHDARFQDPFR